MSRVGEKDVDFAQHALSEIVGGEVSSGGGVALKFCISERATGFLHLVVMDVRIKGRRSNRREVPPAALAITEGDEVGTTRSIECPHSVVEERPREAGHVGDTH